MADHLESLPTKDDVELSDGEKATINKFFGQSGSSDSQKTHNVSTVKLVGYTTLLFLLLSNSFADTVLSKVPYCEGTMGTLVLKTILFALIFLILYKYVA